MARGGDSPDVEWLDILTDEDLATWPPRPPWRAQTWTLPTEGADPTIYVHDNEHYDSAQRGSLPPMGSLPDSWGPVTPMNLYNYRTTVVTLTTRLPFAFGWLVGDAEWAMGIVRGAHGGKWGNFFYRSGAMTEGATERLMAAYLTWRGIPLTRSLPPLARRAIQPHVSPPRQGTYGNAAVARMMAGTTAPPPPLRGPRQSPPSRRNPAPQQRLGPRMYAPWHHRPSAHPKAQLPPSPPSHPPPPPRQPSPHHTNSAPPTPRRLQTLRHHRGPASHRAPDKSLRPNGRHNDTHHETTRPQRSRDTGRHLPGAEPCPAPRRRGRWAPDPINPLAPHTRTWTRPRAPREARPRNPKHHPARPHTVTSRQPARQQQQRPTRYPAHAMAHLTSRRRAQHTRRPKTPPRRRVPLPQNTPSLPGPPTPCTTTPTTPPRAQIPRLRRHPAQRPRGTCRPRHKPNRRLSGTTSHQPGQRYGPQNRHLLVARPPTRYQVQTRHAPPTRPRPRGPRAREAYPGCRPCRKATPERRRDRRTMQPRRLHRQPNHKARSPRWTRRKCRDPHSGQQHHNQ